MRILLLNQTCHPDVASTAQYLGDVATSLVERGHQVTVVCSRRAYDRPSETYAARETWRGVEIRRIACTGFGKGARWRRALDFGSYIVACAWHLLFLRRFDLVIGLTSPPLISWIGAMFTRLKGGRFVFWVMDLNPDEAIAAGWLRAGTRTTRFLQWLLNDSLRQSAAVIALDRFIQLHPGHKDIPYAYYLKGLCFYEQISDVGRDQRITQQALDALAEVVKRYPDTPYARDARLKVELTIDHLAGKEMLVGRYYQKQQQFVGAINRYRMVIERYQTTTHVPEALHRLVECYLALGVKQEAQEAAAVLGYNFPGSDWYADSYFLMTGEDYRFDEKGGGGSGGGWFSKIF